MATIARNAGFLRRQAAVVRRREIIPAGDHRMIRLSMDSNEIIAARYGASMKAVQSIRSGHTGSMLLADELRMREVRRNGYDWRFVLADHLLLFGDARGSGLADQERQEMMDAAHECGCGRLPCDSSLPCGCWPQETP